jgi:hypothetical protein
MYQLRRACNCKRMSAPQDHKYVTIDGQCWTIIPIFDKKKTISSFIMNCVDNCFQKPSTCCTVLMQTFIPPRENYTGNPECVGETVDPQCDLATLASPISEYIASTKEGVQNIEVWGLSGDSNRIYIRIIGTNREIVLTRDKDIAHIVMWHYMNRNFRIMKEADTHISTFTPPSTGVNIATRVRRREEGGRFW